MAKNVALFIDGTWNDAVSPDPTNVRLLSERVKAAAQGCPTRQVHWYVEGVGTDKRHRHMPNWLIEAKQAQPSRRHGARLKRVFDNGLGGVAGYGTARRIKEAYAFLVQHYEDGDRVYLFGFSRGALAVRSLAGFVSRVGLLFAHHIADVDAAFSAYQHGHGLNRLMRRLKLPIAPDPERRTVLPVHMIGVWDTVERLGVPRALQLRRSWQTAYHATEVPDFVSHVRQALALHETRFMFEPLLFKEVHGTQQTLEQVWFPGAHADVGGGYPAAARGLSDAALGWMACEARKLGLFVSTAPVAAEPTKRIHDAIGGKFWWVPPQVRRCLKALPDMAASEVLSHRIHQEATLHLLAPMPCLYGHLPFDVAAIFQEIDRLTGAVAMKLAYELGLAPLQTGPCEPRPEDAFSMSRALPTGLSARDWHGLSNADMADAKAQLAILAIQPETILNHSPERIARLVCIAAALGEQDLFLRLAGSTSALASRLLRTSAPQSIQDGLSVLGRWKVSLNIGREAASLTWAKLAQVTAARVACEHAIVEDHAAKTQAQRRQQILHSRQDKKPKL